MNEFRFICARLIFYERVLKILSVTERHSHLHFTVPPEVLSIYLNRQLVNNDVVFTDFEYIMNFPISTSATPTSQGAFPYVPRRRYAESFEVPRQAAAEAP